MDKAERKKQFKLMTDRINKGHQKSTGSDKLIVMSPTDDSLKIVQVPCGIDAVDKATHGGFVRSAMHTIHGPDGTGKTCLALQLAAVMTQNEEYVLYVSLEDPFPVDMIEAMGINPEYFKLIRARDYAEEVVDVVEAYLYDSKARQANDLVGLVVVDSVNNLVPKREVDKLDKDGAEGEMVAARALLIDKLMRRIQGRNMLENGCIVLLIVQDRANMEPNSHVKSAISAGFSIKYNPKVRIYLGKKPLPRKDGDGFKYYPGHTITVRVEKDNITNKPLYETEYTIIRGQGVDDMEGILESALTLKWIVTDPEIARSAYRFLCTNPNTVVMGKANLSKALRAHRTLLTDLRTAVKGLNARHPPAATVSHVVYDPKLEEQLEENVDDDSTASATMVLPEGVQPFSIDLLEEMVESGVVNTSSATIVQ